MSHFKARRGRLSGRLLRYAATSPVLLGSILGGALLQQPSSAAPYAIPIPPGPFYTPGPCNAAVCPGVPAPIHVPGKEISVGNVPAEEFDRDQVFVNVPGQAVFFDGVPILNQSGLRNSHLYNPPNTPPNNIEVDALAHRYDAFFKEVVEDRVSLLFSVENDKFGNSIFVELPKVPVVALWANSKPTIFGDEVKGYGPLLVGGDPTKVLDPDPDYPYTDKYDPGKQHLVDLDALEVWGPDPWPQRSGYNPGPNDPAYDANCWSPVGDVWNGNSASVICHPIENNDLADADEIIYSKESIADAIGLSPNYASQLDLDALMVYGPEILFSIRPIDTFDGAEVWHWTGSGPAHFLVHGGHVWDTQFDLRGYLILQGFGDMGIAGKPGDVNLDALEAVPGPLPVLGAGAAFGFSRKLRNRIKASRSA